MNYNIVLLAKEASQEIPRRKNNRNSERLQTTQIEQTNSFPRVISTPVVTQNDPVLAHDLFGTLGRHSGRRNKQAFGVHGWGRWKIGTNHPTWFVVLLLICSANLLHEYSVWLLGSSYLLLKGNRKYMWNTIILVWFSLRVIHSASLFVDGSRVLVHNLTRKRSQGSKVTCGRLIWTLPSGCG